MDSTKHFCFTAFDRAYGTSKPAHIFEAFLLPVRNRINSLFSEFFFKEH